MQHLISALRAESGDLLATQILELSRGQALN